MMKREYVHHVEEDDNDAPRSREIARERQLMPTRNLIVLLALLSAGAWSESWAGGVYRVAGADPVETQTGDHCTDIWADLPKPCMAMLDQRHLDADVRNTRPPKAAVGQGLPHQRTYRWSPLPKVDRFVWRDIFENALAFRDAVAEAANQPRCQAMAGEALHGLRSACSADAFARLAMLHRACGEMLYWDGSEYHEGWEVEWEWQRQVLKEEAGEEDYAQRAAKLRERELAYAWRLAKCRQVPKEALRPIEMIRPPHFMGNHGSDQYDQGYSLLRVAARLGSVWANTQGGVDDRQINATVEVNLAFAYLQQAFVASDWSSVPAAMRLPLLLVAREHDLRRSEPQVDWSELIQEFSDQEIDAADPVVERLSGKGWQPLRETAQNSPTEPWAIAPPVVERMFIARRHDDEGNVRWRYPSGSESWFGIDGEIHQVDPDGEWLMQGHSQISTAGVVTRRWIDDDGKERWADKFGHEHWLDEDGAEHWIDWEGTEWILLPVGAPFPELVRIVERPTAGEHAGTEHMSTQGDFNGDGLLDEAYFVQTKGLYALVVALSGVDELTILDDEMVSLAREGISTLPPGKYTAYCAVRFRGTRPCPEGELRELLTEHDSIQSFTYEAAARVLYWNDGQLYELYWAD